MKKRGKLLKVGGVFSLAIGIILVISVPSFSADPITLTFNWEISTGHNTSVVYPFRPDGRFERLVTEYSDGHLKLKIKEGLYGIRDSMLAVGDGRIDMGTNMTAFMSGTYPLLDFGSLPGFFSDIPNVGYEWVDALLDPEMMKILEKYTRKRGFIIIGGATTLPGNAIWGSRPFKTLEDFTGTKIRGGGFLQTRQLSAFGASAVSIPSGEVTEALLKGAIDAIHSTMNYGTEQGWTQLCKYISIWFGGESFPVMIGVNAKKFDALPKDMQNALLKAGAQISHEMANVTEQLAYTYNLWIRSSDCKVIIPEKMELEKAAMRMKPVIEAWLDKAGPYGPDVLRIASKYANGVTSKIIATLVK